MPLKKGKSNATRDANISEMLAAHNKKSQAIAAAYAQQREASKKARSKKAVGK
jgi:ribosomal protein L12E/L44/L45/RPP1/RPP2